MSKDKYYTSRERNEKMNIPVYSESGKIIAYQVSQSFSVRIHQDFYNELSDEEKKKYVEVPSEN